MTSFFFIFIFLFSFSSFFFNDTATTEIYTLSLHDALPICDLLVRKRARLRAPNIQRADRRPFPDQDRKSTRLNSSHLGISYAVFCLKKKKKKKKKNTVQKQQQC